MNRLAFAIAFVMPSVAFAHPGHSHLGMSPNHHLLEGAAVAAVAIGGFLITKTLRKRNR